MITKLRHITRRTARFFEFTVARFFKGIDHRLAAVEERIELWRENRFERKLRPLPRVWSLVGGRACSNPEDVIRKKFPSAYAMRHDDFVTRWFVGRIPVAEVVPDPSGFGRRIFFNEKLSHCIRQA